MRAAGAVGGEKRSKRSKRSEVMGPEPQLAAHHEIAIHLL